jgi:hypothetical protein
LPIFNCRFPIAGPNHRHFSTGNRQSAIANRQSSRFFFASLSRAGLKRTTFALSKLTPRSALQRTLIGTQAGASIDGQNAFNFSVRARNNVNTDQLADPARGSCSSVCGCLHRAHVSANKDRHVTSADILLSQELNIRSFDHCVSSFNGPDETLGLHHSECF